MKGVSLLVLAGMIITAVLAGCGSTGNAKPAISQPAIAIVGVVGAIGGDGDNIDVQRYSYEFTLHNRTANPVQIDWIEPLLAASVTERVMEDNVRVTVGETIAPDGYIIIKSEFHFNAAGLTKQDITGFGDLISGVRAGTAMIIPLPGISQN